ncbi:bifunctional serine/threonine-protein kinase/formylglycine-generating enzyme family protein [Candidatus Uabimicrobium amorphum]|uniref:Serine/threonine protein kinase n=1 Tax=Uabimicrobium amorphum TaxID=2596890 RepID=A0A5S9IPZ4_UABAM|nr:bifunctional serine/threonine-protein kinase/formylglycine-generating enzyme family protein [Candidatus Uabimicrobium amorphum]BBM85963.1 serine/threonine protein kinase [Candidatus Uabimicrobium amorphum]
MDEHRLPDSFIENVKTRSLQEMSPRQATIRSYRIMQELGSGAMGNVYQAIDTRSNKVVAIKSIRSSGNQSHRDRFIREYKLLSIINHENLIRAYEFFEENGYLHMIIEYVEGASLEETLLKKAPLNLSDKLAIANKICRGIEVLNTAGIIHRDIKPANIMINSAKGLTKILDLGIGKNIKQMGENHLTLDGQVLGTAMYLSPEQTKGKITATSDIFSVGTVLYQLFTDTCHSPFDRKGIFECFFAINSFSPLEIKDAVHLEPRWLYEEVSRVVAKAMEKDSNCRWQSAGQMAHIFEELHQKLQHATQRMSSFHITAVNPQLLHSLHAVKIKVRDSDLVTRYVPQMDSPPATKTSTHTTRRRLNKYKDQQKPKSNYAAWMIALLSGAFIGVILMFVVQNFAALGNEEKQNTTRSASVKIETQTKMPLPAKIWDKCWNEKQKYFDFTQLVWKNLRHPQQVQYAGEYQKWYAQQHNLPVEKDFVLRRVNMRMMLIPPGLFFMGSPYFERGRSNQEQQHKVLISKCFWLGKYEVTCEQWKDVTGENPLQQDLRVHRQHPIVFVSYEDIRRKLLPKLGKSFHLPTEAQWEYSCRAGTTSIFYWGNDIGLVGKHANLADQLLSQISFRIQQRVSDGFYLLAPVGSLGQNPFLLHDMMGNVWEWNRDYYGPYQQLNQVQKDPLMTKGYLISIRSGSWSLVQESLMRSASRRGFHPSKRVDFVGLRLMRRCDEK